MKKTQFLRSHWFEVLLSVPKTIIFNFKVLPFSKAIRMPFVVSYHIKTAGVNRRNFIVEQPDMPFASARIGFEHTALSRNSSPRGIIGVNNGTIILKGTVGLSQGVVLFAKDSTITLGNNFRCNYACSIVSIDADITFGDEVVLGWNISVKSDDGHNLIFNGEVRDKSAPVVVGDHVWICSESTLLKGSRIGNDCVVAYGSIVTGSVWESNTLIGGVPAKRLREGVSWQE